MDNGKSGEDLSWSNWNAETTKIIIIRAAWTGRKTTLESTEGSEGRKEEIQEMKLRKIKLIRHRRTSKTL